MPNTNEYGTLRDILIGLDGLLNKELALNTDARSLKGENASDTALPDDWVKKNDAIVGEKESNAERADAGNDSKSTKTGSQSDPYIHKQDIDAYVQRSLASLLGKQMGGNMMMGNDKMEDDGWDDIPDESAGDMEEVGAPPMEGAEMDDDFEQKMNHYKDGEEMMGMGGGIGTGEGMEGGGDAEAVTILNEIKALLANSLVAKQMQLENKQLQREVTDMKSNMDANIKKQVQETLKKFNLREAQNEVKPTRRSAPIQKQSVTEQVAQPGDGIPMHDGTDIAPNQGSFNLNGNMGQYFGNDGQAIHQAILDQTSELIKSDGEKPGSTNFKRFFEGLNAARDAHSGSKIILYDRN